MAASAGANYFSVINPNERRPVGRCVARHTVAGCRRVHRRGKRFRVGARTVVTLRALSGCTSEYTTDVAGLTWLVAMRSIEFEAMKRMIVVRGEGMSEQTPGPQQQAKKTRRERSLHHPPLPIVGCEKLSVE